MVRRSFGTCSNRSIKSSFKSKRLPNKRPSESLFLKGTRQIVGDLLSDNIPIVGRYLRPLSNKFVNHIFKLFD